MRAAQCISLEEQSGSTFKAKISILKDAIKQSQGRVYREAIAVQGENWSPEANPPGFIACTSDFSQAGHNRSSAISLSSSQYKHDTVF